MAVPTAITDLSATIASNVPAGTDQAFPYLDDYLRAAYGFIRQGDTKAADVASAATVDLGAVVGRFVDITGTTTITSFGTVAAGIWREVRFKGALTLTHNATSLILPGGANITTSNGDCLRAYSLGSGNWQVVSYTYNSGDLVTGDRYAVAASANVGFIAKSTGGSGRTWSMSSNTAGTWTLYNSTDSKTPISVHPTTMVVSLQGAYDNTSAGAANVFVDSAGGLYRSTSSARYKRNVADFSGSLGYVMKLRPVRFKSLSKVDGDKEFGGLLAEDVDAAGLPQFVEYDKEGRPDAVMYSQMVTLAFGAIQEQQKQIADLTKRVAVLERRP